MEGGGGGSVLTFLCPWGPMLKKTGKNGGKQSENAFMSLALQKTKFMES